MVGSRVVGSGCRVDVLTNVELKYLGFGFRCLGGSDGRDED